jgi:hypothetical protein
LTINEKWWDRNKPLYHHFFVLTMIFAKLSYPISEFNYF